MTDPIATMRDEVNVAPRTSTLPLPDRRRRELSRGAEHLLLEEGEEQRNPERCDQRVERRPLDEWPHHKPLDESAEQRAHDHRDDERAEPRHVPADARDTAVGPAQPEEEPERADLALRERQHLRALEDQHHAHRDDGVGRAGREAGDDPGDHSSEAPGEVVLEHPAAAALPQHGDLVGARANTVVEVERRPDIRLELQVLDRLAE